FGTRGGRSMATSINGIHEDTGMRSIGELLCVFDRRPNAEPTCNIDWLGRDNFPILDHYGIAPHRKGKIDNPINTTTWRREVRDDYVEKLAIAAAAMNSISVRSDVFCVYFLIHGYLPADVQGLGPSDPMTPSIAKRYMMIVDRSNVIKSSDKPRILLFQE